MTPAMSIVTSWSALVRLPCFVTSAGRFDSLPYASLPTLLPGLDWLWPRLSRESSPACHGLADHLMAIRSTFRYRPRAAGVRVSVIVPVYNAEHTVTRAINSVLGQQFDYWEIVAIDDGSTDSSFRVLQAYQDCIGSDRMRIDRQRNCGAAGARNAGARLAVGEYLAFLDADDEWLPGKLQACVDALDASPNAVVAYSDMRDTNGKTLEPLIGSPTLEFLLGHQFALFPSATVVRRRAFERCGGFSEQFTNHDLGEDTFMGLRLRELGEFVHVSQPLAVYNGSDSSTMVSKYRRGHRTFTRLTKERYGKRSRGVRRHVRRYYCGLLLRAALESLRKRRFSSALLISARAATASPSFVLYCLFNKAKKMTHGPSTENM